MYEYKESVEAKYVDSTPYGHSGGSLRVYIPSLMPQIIMSNPRDITVYLDKSCYCNASDCKPSISTSIISKNYVTAKAPYHSFNGPCYWYGTGIHVQMLNEDALECQILPEDEDNSTDWPY